MIEDNKPPDADSNILDPQCAELAADSGFDIAVVDRGAIVWMKEQLDFPGINVVVKPENGANILSCGYDARRWEIGFHLDGSVTKHRLYLDRSLTFYEAMMLEPRLSISRNSGTLMAIEELRPKPWSKIGAAVVALVQEAFYRVTMKTGGLREAGPFITSGQFFIDLYRHDLFEIILILDPVNWKRDLTLMSRRIFDGSRPAEAELAEDVLSVGNPDIQAIDNICLETIQEFTEHVAYASIGNGLELSEIETRQAQVAVFLSKLVLSWFNFERLKREHAVGR